MNELFTASGMRLVSYVLLAVFSALGMVGSIIDNSNEELALYVIAFLLCLIGGKVEGL